MDTNNTNQLSSFFKNMVDELCLQFPEDKELQDGLHWLDKTEKYGINLNFYEKVYRCLHSYDVQEKAKGWLHDQ